MAHDKAITGREQRAQGAEPRSIGRYAGGPMTLMRHLSEDMDRLLEGFLGFGSRDRWGSTTSESSWWPEIDVAQQGDKLVVQADIPGMKKEDVSVEVRDGELCISGERRSETERSEGSYFQSERSYGSFCRVVPLPAGAKADTAAATFENGVLRIEIEAPGEAGRGRKIEVQETRH